MSVDLLRNRHVNSTLGPFDGSVAALAQIGAEHFFITTNADYVPAVPSIQQPHALFLRSDMRYGTDDPTLWPQQFTSRYCHFAVIANKGARPELDVMWWDPSPADFVVGSAVTRGLGRLRYSQLYQMLVPINELVARVDTLRRTSRSPVSPLFGPLIQTIRIWSEQLRSLPTRYQKMVFAITSLQRAVLELDALYNYLTIYKPRMENYLTGPPEGTPIAQCVGAFTSDPAVAHQLWAARVPFWFLRPSFVFSTENILAIVPLREPIGIASDVPGDGTPQVVYSGNSTLDKIAAIHREAVQTPWYRDPFETTDRHSPGLETADNDSLALSPPLVIQPSTAVPVASSSRSVTRPESRYKPYSQKSPKDSQKQKAPSKDPSKTKTARNKFTPLVIPEMPPSIAAWADALAQVDQSVSPFTSNPADRRYVLPEPALLVNTTYDRRRKWLHHWNLLSDGFMYMLSQPQHTQLLTAQEWRDILAGLLTERGPLDSTTRRRSGNLMDRLRPALEAAGVSSVEGFPVPVDSLPDFTVEQTREIVWRVAEINFRFEFCALDKRASLRDRLDDVKDCFAGHMLLGVPLEMSKRGFAATAADERHTYVLRTAKLMSGWTTRSPRPKIIAPRTHWSPTEMQDLENAVCRYYTQAFWEYFGRAAVVPLCLDHELKDEDGRPIVT